MAIEHGWVVRQDGVTIDPTLPDTDALYFPGLEWKGRAGIKEFLAAELGFQGERPSRPQSPGVSPGD